MYLSNGIIQKKISKIWPGPFRRVSSTMSFPTTSGDGCIGRTTIPVFLRTLVHQFRSGEGPWGPQDCGPGAIRIPGRSGVRPKNTTLQNGPCPKRRIFRKKSERGGGRRAARIAAPERGGGTGTGRRKRETTVRSPEPFRSTGFQRMLILRLARARAHTREDAKFKVHTSCSLFH